MISYFKYIKMTQLEQNHVASWKTSYALLNPLYNPRLRCHMCEGGVWSEACSELSKHILKIFLPSSSLNPLQVSGSFWSWGSEPVMPTPFYHTRFNAPIFAAQNFGQVYRKLIGLPQSTGSVSHCTVKISAVRFLLCLQVWRIENIFFVHLLA